MRNDGVVRPVHVYRLHPPRPNRSDGQVQIHFHCSIVLDPENSRRRIYAVTKANVAVTAGFALIAVTELALGITFTVNAAKSGGEVQFVHRKNNSHPDRVV